MTIYLDHASTTPVDPDVVEAMLTCMSAGGAYGNPSSGHVFGRAAQALITEAANIAVRALGAASSDEIVWTSGATEANNLAIKGLAHANASKGKHIITTAFEHASVLESCQALVQEGFELTMVKPNHEGVISADVINQAIRPDTILISTMFVNNEIGAIVPISEIGVLARCRNIKFHVDAVQAFGKLPIDVKALQVDALSLSAHKFYGPKGIGLLYLSQRPRARVATQIHGGRHQKGRRSGTMPTQQIVGMGCAMQLAVERMEQDLDHCKALRAALIDGLSAIDSIRFNAQGAAAPHILNIEIAGVDGEALAMALDDIAMSSGSACATGSLSTSHVLSAIGKTPQEAHSSVRLSLGRDNTLNEIEHCVKRFTEEVHKLRSMSPLWSSDNALGARYDG